MRSFAWLSLALTPPLLFSQTTARKKLFDASALLKVQRIADPQFSPDIDTNKSLHSAWTVPLEGRRRGSSS